MTDKVNRELNPDLDAYLDELAASGTARARKKTGLKKVSDVLAQPDLLAGVEGRSSSTT